jgi:hypothetical protein
MDKFRTRDEKRCPKCATTKSASEFGTRTRGGLNSWCKGCEYESGLAWRRKNREKVREYARNHYWRDPEKSRRRAKDSKSKGHGRTYWLKYRYGLSPDEYEEMAAHQGGVCAICEQAETTLDYRTQQPRRLSVDHDHETGAVRALLCRRCNHMLGLMEGAPELVHVMQAYLEHFKEGSDGKVSLTG